MKLKQIALWGFLVAGFLAYASSWSSAVSQTTDQEKKMMEQMMKYGTPGKSHELLKRYVGDWDVDIKTWQQSGAAPMASKGTIQSQLIFDGRYVVSHFEGTMGGMASKGLEVIGYDLLKNLYTTFWIDSWSTTFLFTSGKLDASGKVLTEFGTFPDVMTDGKTMQKVKNVTTFPADGKYTFEMFMVGPDGKEWKGLELDCVRRK